MIRPISFAGGVVLVGGLMCHAGLSPQGGGPSPADLKQTVATLAEKTAPPATDYAQMAEDTIRFGADPDAVSKINSGGAHGTDPQRPWRNMIGDALAGVDEGEKLDPRAADWPSLRDQLRKLQPPPPPPQDKKPDRSKDKSQKQKQDQKKDKHSGQEKSDSQQGKGDEQKQDGQNAEGEGGDDSQSPPSQGSGGQGKEGEGASEGQDGGQPKNGQKEDGGQKEAKGKGKDPHGIKDFSSSKQGEGKMRERAKEEDLKPMEDQGAGFGDLGQEKKEQDKKTTATGQMARPSEKKEKSPEAPEGMRMVGGGTGKKEKEGLANPGAIETMARLEQVRQSDSPALLQQRLQTKDQRPSPAAIGKPW